MKYSPLLPPLLVLRKDESKVPLVLRHPALNIKDDEAQPHRNFFLLPAIHVVATACADVMAVVSGRCGRYKPHCMTAFVHGNLREDF